MKKNLKKATALALAAVTVASMSTIAFAKQGEVNGDGFIDASDAALVYLKANQNDGEKIEKLSAATQKRLNTESLVTFDAILAGQPSATDSSVILNYVNKGGSFDQQVAMGLAEAVTKELPTVEPEEGGVYTDGVDLIVKIPERDENGNVKIDPVTKKKICKTIRTPLAAAKEAAEAVKSGEATEEAAAALEKLEKVATTVEDAAGIETAEPVVANAFVFTYGDTAVKVETEAETDDVLAALSPALTAQKDVIESKAVGLKSTLEGFSVNGVKLDKNGWAKLGAQIAGDQTAFSALYPENADDAYVSAFVENVRKAFPLSNKKTALENIDKFNVTSSDKVTLDVDGAKTEGKDALKVFAEKFLYADGTAAGYDFKKLTLDFGGSSTLVVTKEVVK